MVKRIHFHALATDFMTYLMNPDAPTPQELLLAIKNVLVQNIHDPDICDANSGA